MYDDLALANRILYQQGVLDAFGHVSARDPGNPQRFLLSRNLAPALVQPQDILTFDLEGAVQPPGAGAVYLERFIHAAVYRARPEVQAVVHSHSSSIVPFTVSQRHRLRAVCHMGGFLSSGLPLFEIREHAGEESDLLIRNMELGHALATTLSVQSGVLMRGHGITVVGNSLAQAVFRAVYAEKNAAIQAQAITLGEPTYLTDAEAANADAANQGQVQRAWDFWALQARQGGV